MKFHAVIVLFLLLIGCQGNQSTEEQASADVVTGPIRSVDNNLLTSDSLPPIGIQVSDEFDYVGSFPFEIKASGNQYPTEQQGQVIAAGDRYVFAHADTSRIVRKLFVVQLEGFLPDNDLIYNYNFDNAETIGSNKYRHNTWFYNSSLLAELEPDKEEAKTRAFLKENGYELEDEVAMSRFVGLASADRKNEIIIYYIEMMKANTGYTLEEYETSIPREEARQIRDDLVERSRQSFSIVSG